MMDDNYLLGLGFDCDDGHLRITKGKNFRIYGGSDKTHTLMQEKVIRFNEKLDKKGKTIDNISSKEFCDIAYSVGLEMVKQNNQNKRKKKAEGR